MGLWDVVDSVKRYVGTGTAMTAGFDPMGAPLGDPGAVYMKHFAGDVAIRRSPNFTFMSGTKLGMESLGRAGQALGALTLGFSAFNIYQGYSENGAKGAFDAAAWDIATNAAVGHFAYKREILKNGLISVTQPGVGKLVGKGLGAGLGATLGQSIAGAPGAFAGAYVGAAFSSRAGLVAMGAGAVAGGMVMAPAAAMYGAYKLANYGAARTAGQRRIDTAGDMSAFMTGNAMTMRSRAVQAIHKSHLNARSALGQEASFLHQNRNYFSTYR